jgi:hypothetical protein
MQAIQHCTTTKVYLSAALSEFDTLSVSMLAEEPVARGISDPNENVLDPLANSCCICCHECSFTSKHPHAEHPVQLTCGHVLGATCIAKWLETNSTCPLCRAQLHIQNNVHKALNYSLSYVEYLNWRHDVDLEGDTDGESEAEVAWFDAQESIVTPLRGRHQRDEDLWLSGAWEEYTPLDSLNKSRIPFGNIENDTPSLNDSFYELLDCHEQWMAENLYDEGSEDEDALSFFDIFPYQVSISHQLFMFTVARTVVHSGTDKSFGTTLDCVRSAAAQCILTTRLLNKKVIPCSKNCE